MAGSGRIGKNLNTVQLSQDHHGSTVLISSGECRQSEGMTEQTVCRINQEEHCDKMHMLTQLDYRYWMMVIW